MRGLRSNVLRLFSKSYAFTRESNASNVDHYFPTGFDATDFTPKGVTLAKKPNAWIKTFGNQSDELFLK